jgi:hypothetical protein
MEFQLVPQNRNHHCKSCSKTSKVYLTSTPTVKTTNTIYNIYATFKLTSLLVYQKPIQPGNINFSATILAAERARLETDWQKSAKGVPQQQLKLSLPKKRSRQEVRLQYVSVHGPQRFWARIYKTKPVLEDGRASLLEGDIIIY